MLTIQNIPQEVYAVALDYMNQDRAEDGHNEGIYYQIVGRRGWTANELEQAISDYLLRSGAFADGQEFEAVDGWSRRVIKVKLGGTRDD